MIAIRPDGAVAEANWYPWAAALVDAILPDTWTATLYAPGRLPGPPDVATLEVHVAPLGIACKVGIGVGRGPDVIVAALAGIGAAIDRLRSEQGA